MFLNTQSCCYGVLSNLYDFLDLTQEDYIRKYGCEFCRDRDNKARPCHRTLKEVLDERELNMITDEK